VEYVDSHDVSQTAQVVSVGSECAVLPISKEPDTCHWYECSQSIDALIGTKKEERRRRRGQRIF
jgi:hypothetical protein